MKKRDHNKIFEFDDDRYWNLSFIKRWCLAFIKNVIYRLLLLGAKDKERENAKYDVTICAIFKNEAPFLKEWICFHQIIGIQHFYLYNNFSDDNYQDILKPFIDKGIVTLVDWPVPQGQMSSYQNWYETYRQETKWNVFLDLDEFICPRYETNIYSWLKKYKKYPVVEGYWKMFGTSGRLSHDETKLVTEQYTVSWERYDNIGKLFYNTYYDISGFTKGMMHRFYCNYSRFGINLSLPPVNEFGNFGCKNINFVSKEFTLQINHYWSKAFDAYKEKHQRGDAVYEQSPRDFEYFLFHEQKNKSVDYTIYRFIIQLKQRMGMI